MAKRITKDRVKNWAQKAGVTAVPLAVMLIWFLVSLNAITVTGFSGDSVCAGTELDPCVAYINFTANEDIFIYPDEGWSESAFYTDVQAKEVRMYRSWGSGWRRINLSKPCNGAWCGCYWCNAFNGASYSYVFRNDTDYRLKYEVIKYNSNDTIKWSFGPDIDPVFYSTEKDKTFFENNETIILKDALNETTSYLQNFLFLL